MGRTPGPWDTQAGNNHLVRAMSGRLIADACGPSDMPQDEREANARLIAAAPDTVAAAEHVIDGMTPCNVPVSPNGVAPCRCVLFAGHEEPHICTHGFEWTARKGEA